MAANRSRQMWGHLSLWDPTMQKKKHKLMVWDGNVSHDVDATEEHTQHNKNVHTYTYLCNVYWILQERHAILEWILGWAVEEVGSVGSRCVCVEWTPHNWTCALPTYSLTQTSKESPIKGLFFFFFFFFLIKRNQEKKGLSHVIPVLYSLKLYSCMVWDYLRNNETYYYLNPQLLNS